MKIKIFLFIFFLSIYFLFSQTGGDKVYKFLNLANSSRQAALSNNLITADDNDISSVLANPALISENISGHLSLNFTDYFSDINFGFVTYSHTFEELGSFAASLQYINYGRFTEADETGEILGEFSAGDYAFTVGWGRQLSPDFKIGSNLKTIYSSLHQYKSAGIAVDIAGTWLYHEKFFSTTLLFKNIGRQVKAYVPGYTEPLPFEIQVAVHKKLEHVPMGFHFLLHNLQKWDLTYDNAKPKTDPFTGKEIKPKKIEDIANKLMHHVIAGIEFSPSKSFFIRLGYNYHRRKEMTIDSKLSTVGISWGFGIRISKFHISYARSAYHLAGSPNVFTLTTRMSDFFDSEGEF